MGTFSQLTDGMDRLTLLSGGNCNSSTEACNPFHVQIANRAQQLLCYSHKNSQLLSTGHKTIAKEWNNK